MNKNMIIDKIKCNKYNIETIISNKIYNPPHIQTSKM